MSDFIGHNKPPAMAATAGEVAQDLSRWMAENPVITEESVKEATVLIDRAVLCMKDMEDERKTQTEPLNEQLKTINETYRAPRRLLEQVADELKARWSAFVAKVEAERLAQREAARIESERLRLLAEQAQHSAEEAINSAASGELGIDVAGVIQDANTAIADHGRAERKAQIAERETKVKFKGIFKARSLGNRTLEHLVDPWAVMKETGITPGIALEILKAARAYKKIHGKYPPGIELEIQRKI